MCGPCCFGRLLQRSTCSAHEVVMKAGVAAAGAGGTVVTQKRRGLPECCCEASPLQGLQGNSLRCSLELQQRVAQPQQQ